MPIYYYSDPMKGILLGVLGEIYCLGGRRKHA